MINTLPTKSRPILTQLTATTLLVVLARLFPHPPNVTPLIALCFVTMGANRRAVHLTSLLVALALSDLALNGLQGIPAFGSWSLFTYSATAITALSGGYTPPTTKGTFIGVGCGALFFWLWTNFGVWLTSGMYPHSGQGLLQCYTLAIPFLKNTLLGSFGWVVILDTLTRPARSMSFFNMPRNALKDASYT